MAMFLRLLRWLKYHCPPPVRKAINIFYYEPGKITLRIDDIDRLEIDGCLFNMSREAVSIQRIRGNPWFGGARPEDTVLDIGANIGAIAIPLAKKTKRVYAIEPLFANELRENISLNHLANIEVLEYGLGLDGGRLEIEYGPKKAECRLMSFESILKITGQIDFLKVDCEGAEWMIRPEQLSGIREIRMELHIRRKFKKADYRRLAGLLDWLGKNGYRIELKHNVQAAPDVSFAECLLLSAGKPG